MIWKKKKDICLRMSAVFFTGSKNFNTLKNTTPPTPGAPAAPANVAQSDTLKPVTPGFLQADIK